MDILNMSFDVRKKIAVSPWKKSGADIYFQTAIKGDTEADIRFYDGSEQTIFGGTDEYARLRFERGRVYIEPCDRSKGYKIQNKSSGVCLRVTLPSKEVKEALREYSGCYALEIDNRTGGIYFDLRQKM